MKTFTNTLTGLAGSLALFATLGGLVAQSGSFTPIGTGCASKGPVPKLTASGQYRVGSTTTIKVSNVVDKRLGLLFLGLSDKTWAGTKLPFDLSIIGWRGCNLYVSLDASYSEVNSGDTAVFELPHAANPAYVGLELFVQYASSDNSGKPITSNAGKLKLGESAFSINALFPGKKDPYGDKNFEPFKGRVFARHLQETVGAVQTYRSGGFDTLGTFGVEDWKDQKPPTWSLPAPSRTTLNPFKGAEILAIESGNLDGKQGDELFVAIRVSKLIIVRVLGMDTGKWVTKPMFSITSGLTSQNWRNVSVAVADVDGDHRDEVIVCADYEKPTSAGAVAFLRVFRGNRLWLHQDFKKFGQLKPLTGNLDADAGDEIVVVSNGTLYTVFGHQNGALVAKTPIHAPLPGVPGKGSRAVTLGNFDDDPEFELLYTSTLNVSRTVYLVHQRYSFFGTYFGPDKAQGRVKIGASSMVYRITQAIACDADGDGIDEAVVEVKLPGSAYSTIFRFTADKQSTVTDFLQFTSVRTPSRNGSRTDIRVQDDDGDGREEFVVAYMNTNPNKSSPYPWVTNFKRYDLFSVNPKSRKYMDNHVYTTVPALTRADRLMFAPGDFDSDSLICRFRKKEMRLGSPMPITLLMAPPTVADNGNVSSTTGVRRTTSQTKSHGQTTAISASATGGMKIDSFIDFELSATVEASLEKTLTRAKTVSYSAGQAVDWDKNGILFRAMLFMCYDYVVVSAADPNELGQTVTINEPLYDVTRFWPIEDYAMAFPAKDHQLTADITSCVTHTIGAPYSYLSKTGVGAIQRTYRDWTNPTMLRVNKAGTIDWGIKIGLQTGWQQAAKLSVHVDSEFAVGGVLVGFGFGASNTKIYSITTDKETEFYGSIASSQTTPYSVGFLVYHYGIDDAGKRYPKKTPFQVATYWVE